MKLNNVVHNSNSQCNNVVHNSHTDPHVWNVVSCNNMYPLGINSGINIMLQVVASIV